MPFMRPTDQSDRVWEEDGLEIYRVKTGEGKVQIKIRAPGKRKEREWGITDGHFTPYGVEVTFERVLSS